MKTKDINVLPPAIFNLLAAGEVVENPASIVKEAVENSLDAGASEIEIDVEDGGFTEIRVADNGAGCGESQIEKAFLPHATSKISSAKDLERILTLGFRGEALSSIASVSRVEFVSRVAGAEVASKIVLDGGSVLEKTRVGANFGTELVVRDLFFNVPARRKFLGTMRVEENKVTEVVQKLILANPCVRFIYKADGQVVFSFDGGGLLSAVEAVYGGDLVDKLLAVDVNRGGLTLSGFVSKPDFSRRNRTWQTVMVNGRAVEGGVVGAAANDAFSNYLMVGKFPFFVLDFKIDEQAVDVNVHPRKAQVKFEHEQAIFDFVKAAVSESIDKGFLGQGGSSCVAAAAWYGESAFEGFLGAGAEGVTSIDGDNANANYGSGGNALSLLGEKRLGDIRTCETVGSGALGSFLGSGAAGATRVEEAGNVLTFLEKAGKLGFGHRLKEESENTGGKARCKVNPYYEKRRRGDAVQEEINLREFDGKILGCLMDTYILAESGESLYLIDQHAAHERLLFDELTRNIDAESGCRCSDDSFECKHGVALQPLLEPVVLNLGPAEMNKAIEIAPVLNQMGIECSLFGRNSFRVTAVPLAVSARGIGNVIVNVLSEISWPISGRLSDVVREKIISECCRGALKAGQHLTNSQALGFLAQVKNLKVPLCPHGRPVVIALTRAQIEKMFKR